MTIERFDELTRMLETRSSRRALARKLGVGGVLAGLFGLSAGRGTSLARRAGACRKCVQACKQVAAQTGQSIDDCVTVACYNYQVDDQGNVYPPVCRGRPAGAPRTSRLRERGRRPPAPFAFARRDVRAASRRHLAVILRDSSRSDWCIRPLRLASRIPGNPVAHSVQSPPSRYRGNGRNRLWQSRPTQRRISPRGRKCWEVRHGCEGGEHGDSGALRD